MNTTTFRLTSIVILSLLGVSPLEAATVTWCPANPGCLCIDWDAPGGSNIEIRCPSSSVWKVGSSIIGGTFAGRGVAETSVPPSTLALSQKQAVTEATDMAKNLLSGLSGNHACPALFNGSPLLNKSWVSHPLLLISDYIVWANGEGVVDSNGVRPCTRSDAWTVCCGHSRIVFICNSFKQRTTIVQAQKLIHEALHVAGQTEDGRNSTAGPNDPPSSNHINSAVAAVCN